MSASRKADPRLKVSLVKAFLLRCEILGWVTKSGRLVWWRRFECRAYWAGVRMTLAHTANGAAFDADLDELTRAPDPFVHASRLHRELCAVMHGEALT